MPLNPACCDHLAVEPPSPPPPSPSLKSTGVICGGISDCFSSDQKRPKLQTPSSSRPTADACCLVWRSGAADCGNKAAGPPSGSPNLPDSMFAKVRRQTPSRSERRLDSPPMKANFFPTFSRVVQGRSASCQNGQIRMNPRV